ncbi:polyphosphate kinase 2 [Campylobacter sputorum subsp. sputorum]|uniref:polyphosphate kinase 2 n=1 Tax=Campylobacter sputorum TaxID=206 RepID=UPI0011EA7D35|nr:polyphosphate kinase 2 [Campylobacter sputorum]KAB0582903.1 polyphosphate kinase 2 [Campylobacter sputorum subsp. sputorum]QEL05545.1 polyphosphate kinase 2 [Campylobacter sputorum subsp. sputorum]
MSNEEKKENRKKEKKEKKKAYEKELKDLQVELLKMQYYVKKEGLKLLIIMEGRDAAGKGGTIKRITEHLNPRGCRVVALQKPSDIETTQWYFQRYVAHLPSAGEIVIFDRSWYNRAMVEPVMGFCTQEEHRDFLQEVPGFENLLSKSGIKIFKFFLSINKEAQAKRFKSRRTNPLKRFKISPVDDMAQDFWNKYSMAQGSMFLQTDTDINPWIVIDSNNKKQARLNTIKSILNKIDYEDKCSKDKLKVDTQKVRTAADELKVIEEAIKKIKVIL